MIYNTLTFGVKNAFCVWVYVGEKLEKSLNFDMTFNEHTFVVVDYNPVYQPQADMCI